MYRLRPGLKQDPVRHWNLPDRIFFGYGACHILAGVYLRQITESSHSTDIHARWIKPAEGFSGNHIVVTDGDFAFDFHGYSCWSRLLAHHSGAYEREYPRWAAEVVRVDFDLLLTDDLNQRNMRGPNQYLFCPIHRSLQFLRRIKHGPLERLGYQLSLD